MKEERVIEILSRIISKGRLKHSLGVRDTAVRLAKIYDVDQDKAGLAALLHDCAKGIADEILLKKAKEFSIVVDDIYKKVPALLHGPVGAQIARDKFGIKDEEVLRAIRVHTLGSQDMTPLEKVVFLADFIEPNRRCEGLDRLREELKGKTLDESIRIVCERTIRYNLDLGRIIHPQTILTRNSLI